ncbi:MFS transporter [Streptomyces sp. NPDC057027]|uniref:MFS transporter n=1 Tax=Streptomyces sp. NPDC057027 TaxID=3346004 RepID=UPI0036280CB5
MPITVLTQGAVFTTSTYLAPLLRDVSNFAPAMVGILLIVFGIGSVLGNILGGRAADTNVMRGVLTAQTALLASLVLFWALSPHQIPAAAALFLFGAAGFSIIPALQARILSVAAAAPALALSANVSAFNLGNGLGAWLGGTTIGLGLGVRDVTLTAALATTTALLLSPAMWARTRRPDTRLPRPRHHPEHHRHPGPPEDPVAPHSDPTVQGPHPRRRARPPRMPVQDPAHDNSQVPSHPSPHDEPQHLQDTPHPAPAGMLHGRPQHKCPPPGTTAPHSHSA